MSTENKLKKPPRGFAADHPFVEDLKLKSYIASVPLEDEKVCGNRFLRDFTVECKKMAPLVEFTAKALGLKY